MVNRDKLERSIEYKEILPKAVTQASESKKDPRQEILHLSRQVTRYASMLERSVQDLGETQVVQGGASGKKERGSLKMNDLVQFGLQSIPLRAVIQVVGHFLLQKERHCLINLASVSHSVRDHLVPLLILYKWEKLQTAKQMAEAVNMDAITSTQVPQGLRAAVSSGVTAVTKGLMSIRIGEHASLQTKVEELEDLVNGLKKEREQLYAQIQADALIKKFQDQKIKDLENTKKDPSLQASESTMRAQELEKSCEELRNQLAESERQLQEERAKRKQEEEHFQRAKKVIAVLAAEVHKLRQQVGLNGNGNGSASK
ncbi:hypothetical protein GUITHDRAFT_113778 [Guillardia theta CCMP2712]|uniref:Uncharacterized protein n=1 Tax=Guillardia theta (strain CCMP2712) TaxID=905079 RepID=L1IUV1_GUITC|nr:hypothetical protein GUITHDRAFT_113778 [Guillardia theta CCMP2712]EKX40041.1 hypothetical protein GUITHDRAFT_113778 [Guillardia theta CCMP2712]|eukprot:XP_005827021.1 hypothetical protein GUITHDRAFT_113778 [Guillardia theta CCMP2712]